MKWDLRYIKLIYPANNSSKNKRHPIDAFFIIKVRLFLTALLVGRDLNYPNLQHIHLIPVYRPLRLNPQFYLWYKVYRCNFY